MVKKLEGIDLTVCGLPRGEDNMEIMIRKLAMKSGEQIEIRETSDGEHVCPVCGAILSSDPPYALVTEVDGKQIEPFATGSFEICATCGTEFGVDDYVSSKEPVGSQSKKWQELREIWKRK